ncbi:NGFI-A-binding protein [Schistosoma japonicum]|uniref:NGFI-A-binding protein n=1 Tax=Schistosoma japonicum TaxID=6182 RepID=A0A4Z2CUP1_SCHJA|nr:NGFI-A-binding protein [Schistosoma japonicum]
MDTKRNLLQNLGELEVYILLQNAKLLQYFDAFINHGGDDIQQLTETLKDPNEFDQLMKLVGMDKKPLHIQRFKKALIQYSTQNTISINLQSTPNQSKLNDTLSADGSNSNTDHTTISSCSNDNNFINSNWYSFIPSTYSGLNLFPTPPIMNSFPSTQCILPNNPQNLTPLFNQWAILNNNPQYHSMLQSLAMNISNQHFLASMKNINGIDNRFGDIHNIGEISQTSIKNNTVDSSPILSRNNSPYSPQPLHQPPTLRPLPLTTLSPSSSKEMQLASNVQISVSNHVINTTYTEDALKVRPSATLMKSDYLKLEIAINALIPYLPRFQIRKPNSNSRNTNEHEIQEILKLSESDPNRINGLRKYSLIFGRTDSMKRLTRPLRHFEITINEITFRLVKQIPELVTQREHLFHIARQIVNIMNYGLSVNQTGQVTWKILKEELSKKSVSDYKLSNSDDECLFEMNEAEYSNETLIQVLHQLKLEMQDVVDEEDILRNKIRCPNKELSSTKHANSIRGDLDKIVNKLHKCITTTVKYIILLQCLNNAQSQQSERNQSPMFSSSPDNANSISGNKTDSGN